MMTEPKPIHCIFYSHVWAVHMLKYAGLNTNHNNVIVELATTSNLAGVFGEQGKARYGLAGLLRLSGRLEQFAQMYKNVIAPLVLAPRPEVPAVALNSAVGLLASSPTPYTHIHLLVHIEDAPKFAGAYPHVNRFSMLWDLGDPPTAALGPLAETLVDNHCIQAETWGGFFFYQHPNRPVADLAQRQEAFQQVLRQYPLLSGQTSS